VDGKVMGLNFKPPCVFVYLPILFHFLNVWNAEYNDAVIVLHFEIAAYTVYAFPYPPSTLQVGSLLLPLLQSPNH
jgi:hypothetical protein